LKNKIILVTGGAGYVGSALIPTLIDEGYYVKCLDRFFFGDEFLRQKKFEGKLILSRMILDGLILKFFLMLIVF